MQTPVRMIQATALTAVAALLYPATNPNAKTLIKKFTVTNTAAVVVTMTIYLVPSGGTALATNAITITRNVPAQLAGQASTLELYEIENHLLEAGDAIWGLASAAASLNVMASGILIS